MTTRKSRVRFGYCLSTEHPVRPCTTTPRSSPGPRPRLRLRRLALCDATVDLEFERGSDGATRWRVLEGTGRIDVVEAAPESTGRAG